MLGLWADRKWARWQSQRQRALIYSELRNFLNQLIMPGNVVMVHSSLSLLNTELSADDILDLLSDLIGPGLLILPTFPRQPSYQFLKSGFQFANDLPSGMGILTNRALLRGERSQHPTKSIVAIGNDAKAFVKDHDKCPLAFDTKSPFARLIEANAKLIGLGVWSYNLSFVHTIDDHLQAQFPICPYDPTPFYAPTLTFAHSPRIGPDTARVPSYMRKHIQRQIFQDFTWRGRRFFYGHAKALYQYMANYAQRGIHIYPRLTPSFERQQWETILDQINRLH